MSRTIWGGVNQVLKLTDVVDIATMMPSTQLREFSLEKLGLPDSDSVALHAGNA
jgi:hypothetical protein